MDTYLALGVLAGVVLAFLFVTSRVGPLAHRTGDPRGPLPPEVVRTRGRRQMVRGVAWLAGGGTVNALIYLAATGGGTSAVAWAAMAYGAFLVLWGAWRHKTGR